MLKSTSVRSKAPARPKETAHQNHQAGSPGEPRGSIEAKKYARWGMEASRKTPKAHHNTINEAFSVVKVFMLSKSSHCLVGSLLLDLVSCCFSLLAGHSFVRSFVHS